MTNDDEVIELTPIQTTHIPAVIPEIEVGAMSVESLTAQMVIVKEAMTSVMKKDEHYGVIPGCGKKPSLLKPGAEKLCMMFRLAPEYKVIRRPMENGHVEHEVVCTLRHIQSGLAFGQGVGSCSTMETKYRYRTSDRVCPKCEKEGTVIKGQEQYGGGWICWTKKGGCGAKFNNGDKTIEDQRLERVEYDNPADYYNTVLKMAKKRAQVDAVLTVTAASDMFTQDLEELKANGVIGDGTPQYDNDPPVPTKKPQAQSKQPPPAQPDLDSKLQDAADWLTSSKDIDEMSHTWGQLTAANTKATMKKLEPIKNKHKVELIAKQEREDAQP